MAHHTLPIPPRRNTSGFTLLEMSIVLAIIGLLVGGIMAGQTFITNSRLNSLVGESRYYINAFNQFNNQYKAIPGDFSSASNWWPTAGAHNGDGNGLIRAGAAINNGELFGVFEHLALAGSIKGSYTGATTGVAGTTVATIGTNIPPSVIENVGFLFNHPDSPDGSVPSNTATLYPNDTSRYFDGKYGHVLIVAGTTANNLPSTGFLKPAQALQIDDKYDDGAPSTGWITTYKPGTATNIVDCATTSVAAPTVYTYNVSLKTKPCYLIINIPGS